MKRYLKILSFLFGLLFSVFIILRGGDDFDMAVRMAAVSPLLALSALSDFKNMTVPNYVIALLGIEGTLMLIVCAIFKPESFLENLLTGVVGFILSFLILLIISLLSKGGFGMGDVKLLSALSYIIGIIPVLSMMFYALFACLLVSLFMIFIKKRDKKKPIAFVPFIYFGFILDVIFIL